MVVTLIFFFSSSHRCNSFIKVRDQGSHGLFRSMCCRIILLEMPILSFFNSVSCSYISLNSHFKKLSHSLCSNVTSHLCFYAV